MALRLTWRSFGTDFPPVHSIVGCFPSKQPDLKASWLKCQINTADATLQLRWEVVEGTKNRAPGMLGEFLHNLGCCPSLRNTCRKHP